MQQSPHNASTWVRPRTHASFAHTQVGSALFVAPEVLSNSVGAPYDGAAADVWSCGVILFYMLFGRHPYLQPQDDASSPVEQVLALFKRWAGRRRAVPMLM